MIGIRTLCDSRIGCSAARVCLLVLSCLASICAGAPTPAVIQQPRAFGHVLGDVLTQRILLESARGQSEVPILPAVARVSVWLDRLPARIETDAQGHSWLNLDYQVINVPNHLELASIPALTLKFKSGQVLSIPDWPFSIASFTPDTVYDTGDLRSMRPDYEAPLYRTNDVQRQLGMWAGLFGCTLVAWLGWLLWQNARDATRMPFARAARAVRRFAGEGAVESNDAWMALHRAFNEAAGSTVQPESLQRLFDRAPYLEPLRSDIERFFEVSSARFFARAPAVTSIQLDELSRGLKRAEKRGS